MEIKKIRWFNIIGIIILVLGVISLFAFQNDEFGLHITLISLPLIILSVFFFIFNLVYYFKNKNKFLGSIIFGILLVFFVLVLIISTLGLFRTMPFDHWDIAGWFLYPLQIVIVIILIISEIIINR